MAFVRIPADLSRVAEVRGKVDEANLSEILSPGRLFDLKVAVSEACANAIEHAESYVQVFLWALPAQVIAEISNVGRFRPRSWARRDDQNRGFGLSLMFTLADEVNFSKNRSGKTIIRLSFNSDRDGLQTCD